MTLWPIGCIMIGKKWQSFSSNYFKANTMNCRCQRLFNSCHFLLQINTQFAVLPSSLLRQTIVLYGKAICFETWPILAKRILKAKSSFWNSQSDLANLRTESPILSAFVYFSLWEKWGALNFHSFPIFFQ